MVLDSLFLLTAYAIIFAKICALLRQFISYLSKIFINANEVFDGFNNGISNLSNRTKICVRNGNFSSFQVFSLIEQPRLYLHVPLLY